METRSGQRALAHGKWKWKAGNFTTLEEAREWGKKMFPEAVANAEKVGPRLCYGYTRVSSIEQSDSGLSLEYQADAILRHFETRIKRQHPGIGWGEMIADPAQSAFEKPFVRRPGGCRLNAMLRTGDHVIFARMDRAFRQGADYFRMSESWSKRGIIVHYIDPDVDGSTASGWAFLSIMAVQAELYSRRISEATKAGFRARKARGCTMFHNNQPDAGKAVVWCKSKRIYMDVPASPSYYDDCRKAAELLVNYGQVVAQDLFQDYLNRDDPNYKRPLRSKYRYTYHAMLQLAGRHVGLETRRVSLGAIREAYRAMPDPSVSAMFDTAHSGS